MPDCVSNIGARSHVVGLQQLSEQNLAIKGVSRSEHPSRIGCEGPLSCSCGKLECFNLPLARLVPKFAQGFRRMQPIRASRVQKCGDDLAYPLLSFALAARRLGKNAPDSNSVSWLVSSGCQFALE